MESVSTDFLIDLALDLTGDWVKLARALGLEDKVERISRDNENNVAEQAYRMLLAWKERNGTLATLEVLSEGLRKPTVSRRDLAQKYCENYNQGSSNAEINLGRQLRRGQISEDDRTSISKVLGKDWLWVGRLLDIEDAALDNLKELHKHLDECSYHMLKTWARTSGDQATYELLARALLHRAVGKRDIVEKYCLERRQPQSENRPGVPSSPTGLSGPLSHLGIQLATGATEGWDVTDSSLSPLESKLPVENAEEEQGPLAECDILHLDSQQYPTKVLLQQKNRTLDKLRKDLLGKEMK